MAERHDNVVGDAQNPENRAQAEQAPAAAPARGWALPGPSYFKYIMFISIIFQVFKYY